jgi:multiple sugar transport system permease protein
MTRGRREKTIFEDALFYGLLLLVLFYSLAPLLWQGITSIKGDAILTSLPPVFPQEATAVHYRAIFGHLAFLKAIINSLIVSTFSTVAALALASPAAFSLSKLPLPGKGGLLAIVLSVSMFPPIAVVSPLYLIVRGLGLRDTVWGLILTYTVFSLPLGIWIMTNFFDEIPDELYRAARVDGCTPLQAFARIMLPIAAPGFFTAAILIFIFCWNEFLFALTFTTTSASRTVPVEIALFPGLHEVPYGDMAAASISVTAPVVLLAFLFQRRIVAGLTAGAVKG